MLWPGVTSRYARPRYIRGLLASSCALSLIVAAAPFLIVSQLPEKVATSASAVGTLIGLSTALACLIVVGASMARRQVDWRAHVALLESEVSDEDGEGGTGPKSANKLSCGACGGVAGLLFCPQCGTIRDISGGWVTRLSLLIVRRWPPIIGFVLTVYIPGAYSLLHESARQSAEADQRKEETVRQFATAWSDFRGPLITFGAECGVEAQRGQAFSSRCKELVDRTIGAYTKTSWYLPGLIGELRTSACAPVDATQDDDLRTTACRKIKADYAITFTNNAFRVFVDAYNEYARAQATSSSPRESAPAAQRLGCAASAFYVEARRLGCAIMIASLPPSMKSERLLPFCDYYFGLGSHDDEPPLQWGRWFGGSKDQCSDPMAVGMCENLTEE
jgi:hypothetical protein